MGNVIWNISVSTEYAQFTPIICVSEPFSHTLHCETIVSNIIGAEIADKVPFKKTWNLRELTVYLEKVEFPKKYYSNVQ